MNPQLPALVVRMLRYRVAAMIWLFMLLGAAFGGPAIRADLRWAAAILALGWGYVAATTINDLADEPIDRVNHPGDRGRPLVTGDASRRDLYVLHALAIAAALASGLVLGARAAAVVAASLVIGHTYSARPVRFSYRTYLAPLVLGIAYVLVPYALALEVVGAAPRAADGAFAGALYLLFLARITLKDFRDREGDRRYGRPTLLLRHGKNITCLVSLAALTAGSVLLVASVRPGVAVTAAVGLFVAAIASRLHALWRTDDSHREQLAIGVGAKMGNGLLITVLGVLILRAEQATATEQALLAATVTVLYGASFLAVLARPERAVIVYKG